jgi:hypothetical protein
VPIQSKCREPSVDQTSSRDLEHIGGGGLLLQCLCQQLLRLRKFACSLVELPSQVACRPESEKSMPGKTTPGLELIISGAAYPAGLVATAAQRGDLPPGKLIGDLLDRHVAKLV